MRSPRRNVVPMLPRRRLYPIHRPRETTRGGLANTPAQRTKKRGAYRASELMKKWLLDGSDKSPPTRHCEERVPERRGNLIHLSHSRTRDCRGRLGSLAMTRSEAIPNFVGPVLLAELQAVCGQSNPPPAFQYLLLPFLLIPGHFSCSIRQPRLCRFMRVSQGADYGRWRASLQRNMVLCFPVGGCGEAAAIDGFVFL